MKRERKKNLSRRRSPATAEHEEEHEEEAEPTGGNLRNKYIQP